MAFPSVTNTFVNGQSADAGEVNTNFTDLVNGFSDGNSDLNMSAGTFGGAVTCNGNVTLGNGTGDDITITGSIAATINIKTDGSFDLGSTAKGMQVVYFGDGGGNTVGVQAPSIASNFTMTLPGFTSVLPAADGLAGSSLTTNGSGTFQFEPMIGPSTANNYSIATSVGSSALTVTLKGGDGNNLSSTNLCRLLFRNSTATSGTPDDVEVTSNLTLTLSSGSTVGFISGNTEYLYVYAVNNAGTVVLGLSSNFFDEGELISTTAEGGAGGADSRGVIYTSSGLSSKAIRLLGRIKFSLTTAGTWDEAGDEISLPPFKPVASVIRLNGNNGSGSTNTRIRRWSTIVERRGPDMTLTQSAADGDSITINTAGTYFMAYSDEYTAAQWLGISRDSNQLTTGIEAITDSHCLIIGLTAAADVAGAVAVSIYCDKDAVIRAHNAGGATGSDATHAHFVIAKVG